MKENKLAPEIPPTQEEQILRLARQLSRGQEEVCTQEELREHRRRDMFERVALAEISAGSEFFWDSVAGTAELILKDADKFAKGE